MDILKPHRPHRKAQARRFQLARSCDRAETRGMRNNESDGEDRTVAQSGSCKLSAEVSETRCISSVVAALKVQNTKNGALQRN